MRIFKLYYIPIVECSYSNPHAALRLQKYHVSSTELYQELFGIYESY
jgi:hypothetical protein